MKSNRSLKDGVLKFVLKPDSPCPCGSHRKIVNCCYTPMGFVKRPAQLRPPGQPTGLSLEGCYASPLADCSSKISREHFISESLLELIERNGGLHISGYAWQEPGTIKKTSPNSLASKILCSRHNAALSPLDQAAAFLFESIYDYQASQKSLRRLRLLSGHDVERWLLKVLCGLTLVNNFGGKHGAKNEVERHWLDVLYGRSDFQGDAGLYVCREPGNEFSGPIGAIWKAVIDSDRIAGIGVVLCGLEFVLALDGFPDRRFDDRAFAYRPHEIHVTGKDYEKSILFSWQGRADLGSIIIDHDARPNASAQSQT